MEFADRGARFRRVSESRKESDEDAFTAGDSLEGVAADIGDSPKI